MTPFRVQDFTHRRHFTAAPHRAHLASVTQDGSATKELHKDKRVPVLWTSVACGSMQSLTVKLWWDSAYGEEQRPEAQPGRRQGRLERKVRTYPGWGWGCHGSQARHTKLH